MLAVSLLVANPSCPKKQTNSRPAPGPSPSSSIINHGERNHQGLGNAYVFLDTTAPRIRVYPHLGFDFAIPTKSSLIWFLDFEDAHFKIGR